MHPAVAMHEIEEQILAELHAHRLLTTQQLHELAAPHRDPSVVRRMLGRMRDHRGLVACVHPKWEHRKPTRTLIWFLTHQGAKVAESAETCGKRKQMTEALAAGPLQQHTLAVNDVGLVFLREARKTGGEAWWEHERPVVEITSSRRGLPKDEPLCDALLVYRTEEETHRRFIELDRSTTRHDVLAQKLADYQRLWGSHRWVSRSETEVLVVLTGASPEQLKQRLRKTVSAYHGKTAELVRWTGAYDNDGNKVLEWRRSGMPLRFATLEDLLEDGLGARCFSTHEWSWTDGLLGD